MKKRKNPTEKKSTVEEDPVDYVPPNKRPPKRVTWGYVKRRYLNNSNMDEE